MVFKKPVGVALRDMV